MKSVEWTRDRGRGLRRAGWPIVLIAALFVLAAPVGAVVLAQLAQNAPSPASGHAEVIAHGVSGMPANQLAWRVVEDTAEPLENAQPEERALGFTLADADAVLINDVSFGTQARLAAGEAAFVPNGVQQQRIGMGSANTSYYRIALVSSAEAADAGGDALLFASDAFDAPVAQNDGGFDIDLVRDVLDTDEETELFDAGFPTLVLATAGEVTIESSSSAESVTLGAGESASLSGDLIVSGTSDDAATFVAALIGPEVPPPPVPPVGSITIDVLGCPAPLSAAAAEEAGFGSEAMADCAPVALDPAASLLGANGDPIAPSVDDESGTYVWNGMPYGTYGVAEPTLPEEYADYRLVDADGQVIDPLALTVSDAAVDVTATFYLFSPPGGSLTLAAYNCPVGMTAENLVGDACDAISGDFGFTLTNADGSTVLTLDDATAASANIFTFENLPFDTYTVEETPIPEGYAEVLIPGMEVDSDTGLFTVTITEDDADQTFSVFNIAAEAAAGPGSITAVIFDCPVGMTRDDFAGEACQESDQATTGFDLLLSASTGETLGLDQAEVNGNVVTWSGLEFGEYYVEETTLPEGYTDAYAPNTTTSGLNPAAYQVIIAEADPDGEIAIYNLAPADAAPPADTDDDGLSDAVETDQYGTDPNTPDTDGDGRTDGDEVGPQTVISDPLDPDTDDDGVGDGDEVANGTDPSDPAS